MVIDNCTFERLDGNSAMRATTETPPSSTRNSATLVATPSRCWVYTKETQFDPGRPGIELTGYPDAGVDGTDGEHPKFTTVTGNVVREVGLYEKQSSVSTQAKV